MPAFVKGGAARTPFGKNEFLRSTRDLKFESYTCSAASVTAETIDGFAGQKILQPGEVMAKITSTAEAGKVGPFDLGSVTDGRQTAANIVGINNTFLPWQLIERDVEISVVYEASVIKAWCFLRTNGVRALFGVTAPENAVATAMSAGGTAPGVSILFK